jgi:hypothetical protein
VPAEIGRKTLGETREWLVYLMPVHGRLSLRESALGEHTFAERKATIILCPWYHLT